MATSTETMLKVVEPATEGVLAELPHATADDADAAVARAQGGVSGVARRRPRRPRARSCARSPRRSPVRVEDLARLEARNVGKPISDARGEVGMVASTFHYYAGAPERLLGDTIPVAGGDRHDLPRAARRRRADRAVELPARDRLAGRSAPALAAGNTIVLKPAELTPLTAIELEKIALEAGLPEGVLNVVVGPGPRRRRAARRSIPDVAKVAFTGSTAVGRRIGALAADSIKRVTLELGGKSANVIFADADLEAAAAAAPSARCSATPGRTAARARGSSSSAARSTRFMPLLEDCGQGAAGRRPARRRDRDGPADLRRPARDGRLVRRRRRRRSRSAGTRPTGPGFWFPPTVLCPVSNDDRAAREEIFGPVAAVIPFDDEDEAIRLANDTIYGLSGSIWTRDGARALRVARAIESGALSINSNTSVRVHDAVRRLQAVGHRPRARPARARALHRAEERVHGDGVTTRRSRRQPTGATSTASSAGRPAPRARRPPSTPVHTSTREVGYGSAPCSAYPIA